MSNAHSSTATKESKKTTYSILSSAIGFILALAAVATGFEYYYAPYPAHGPVGVLGILYIIFGLTIGIGSVLVLTKKATVLGAILILGPGLLAGPQTLGNFIPNSFGIDWIVGYALPIASFILALCSRGKKE